MSDGTGNWNSNTRARCETTLKAWGEFWFLGPFNRSETVGELWADPTATMTVRRVKISSFSPYLEYKRNRKKGCEREKEGGMWERKRERQKKLPSTRLEIYEVAGKNVLHPYNDLPRDSGFHKGVMNRSFNVPSLASHIKTNKKKTEKEKRKKRKKWEKLLRMKNQHSLRDFSSHRDVICCNYALFISEIIQRYDINCHSNIYALLHDVITHNATSEWRR